MWSVGSGDRHHEPGKEVSKFIMCVEGQDVGHVLIWPHDNDATLRPVNSSAVKDVGPMLQIRAEDLFVVNESEPALAGQKKRWHAVDGKVSVGLLAYGTDIDRRINIAICVCITIHRRIRVRLQEVAECCKP